MRDFEDWQHSRNLIIRPESGGTGSDNKESNSDESRKRRTRLSEFGHAEQGLQPENKVGFQALSQSNERYRGLVTLRHVDQIEKGNIVFVVQCYHEPL